MRILLAAIRSAAPGAAEATPEPAKTPLRDIQPPVDIFPFTPLQIVLASLVLLALIGLLAWWLARRRAARPVPPPPTPRQIALEALARLREQVRTLDPYAFSIAVSEVLRTFVEGQYHLRAREQTSPEFLAAIASAPSFTGDDRKLLADFLDRCDMIKFARVEADASVSEQLLGSATAFVQGVAL